MVRRLILSVMLSGLLPACASMEKEEEHLKETEKSVEKKAEPFLNACKAEIDKICKSAGNDKTKQAQCLKQNRTQAGVACRNAIEKAEKPAAKK